MCENTCFEDLPEALATMLEAGLSLSEYELQLIVKTVEFQQGHMCKCRDGQIYNVCHCHMLRSRVPTKICTVCCGWLGH